MTDANNVPLPDKIVDSHVHLWDLKRLHMPWIGPPLDRDFLIGDYLSAAKGLNVVKGVYVEVGVGAEQRYEEAEIISELCRADDNPLAGVVMSGDVSYGHFIRYLEGTIGRRWVKGVRQGLPQDAKTTSAFVRGVQRLGELDVVFELNTELPRALALIEQCPDTRFVVDHCGGATHETLGDEGKLTQWANHITLISRHPNVACKLSGIIASAPTEKWEGVDLSPVINHLLESFGPQRLMFGGDWPICTLSISLRDWVLRLAGLLKQQDAEARAAIFHDTATRWYRLEESNG